MSIELSVVGRRNYQGVYEEGVEDLLEGLGFS